MPTAQCTTFSWRHQLKYGTWPVNLWVADTSLTVNTWNISCVTKKELTFGYERMEEAGVMSPVMAVTCEYKRPTTFPDIIDIEVSVAEMSKLKAKFEYKMTHNGVLVCHATSTHCFLGTDGRPVALETRFPEFHQALLGIMSE